LALSNSYIFIKDYLDSLIIEPNKDDMDKEVVGIFFNEEIVGGIQDY